MSKIVSMVLVFICGCYGTSVTLDVNRSFPSEFSGSGSTSDPYNPDLGYINSYGISITTWIDKPSVRVELPKVELDIPHEVLDIPYRIVDSLKARPVVAKQTEKSEKPGYVGALDSLGSWDTGKIIALTLPILAISFGMYLLYRHRKSNDA